MRKIFQFQSQNNFPTTLPNRKTLFPIEDKCKISFTTQQPIKFTLIYLLNAMAHTKNSNSYNCFENQLPFYKSFLSTWKKISKCKFTYEFRFLTDPEWNLPPSPLMRFIACRCRDSWRYFWKKITTLMNELGPF